MEEGLVEDSSRPEALWVSRPVMVALILTTLILLLAFAGACEGSTTPAPGGSSGGAGGSPSGVEGYVTIGPIAPVEQPGVTNTRPYSVRLTIRTAPDGKLVVATTSGPDGRFRINLPPGEYRLEPKEGDPYPTAAPVDFTVIKGKFTEVNVNFDSGIR